MLRAVLHREVSKSNSATHSPALTKRSYAGASSPKAIGRFTIGPTTLGHDKLSSPATPEFINNDFSPTITDASKVITPSILISDNLSQHRLSAASTDYTPGSPTSIKTGSELSSIFIKRLQSMSSRSQSQYTSMSHISHHQSIRDLFPKEYDNESLASTLVCALQPSDALTPKYRLGHRSISTIMGSILSLPTSLAIVKDDLSRIGDFNAVPDEKGFKDHILSMLESLKIIRNKPFLVFITTCFMLAFGESPVAIYLPSYAISKGTSVIEASSLYTALGFGSMTGRFLSGLIASDNRIGPILLHIGCLNIAGLLIALSPVITETFASQVVQAAMFGLYSGSMVPLSSLIVIELLGIEEMGQGFGVLCLFQGVGFLMGPPCAGLIVKVFGYEKAFLFSGVVLITASLVEMLTTVLVKPASDVDCDVESLHELEKALRKISDDAIESESVHGDSTDHNHISDDKMTQEMMTINEEKENTNNHKLVGQDETITHNHVGKDESKDATESIKHGTEDLLLLEPIAEEGEKQSLSDLDT